MPSLFSGVKSLSFFETIGIIVGTGWSYLEELHLSPPNSLCNFSGKIHKSENHKAGNCITLPETSPEFPYVHLEPGPSEFSGLQLLSANWSHPCFSCGVFWSLIIANKTRERAGGEVTELTDSQDHCS